MEYKISDLFRAAVMIRRQASELDARMRRSVGEFDRVVSDPDQVGELRALAGRLEAEGRRVFHLTTNRPLDKARA